jgi:hypothetical protein
MKRHVLSVHERKKPFKCNICDASSFKNTMFKKKACRKGGGSGGQLPPIFWPRLYFSPPPDFWVDFPKALNLMY